MAPYLRCLRVHRGTNAPECRAFAKAYLQCRMERYDPTSLSLTPCPTYSKSLSLHAGTPRIHLFSRVAVQRKFSEMRKPARRSALSLSLSRHRSELGNSHFADPIQHPEQTKTRKRKLTSCPPSNRNLMAPDELRNLGFADDGGNSGSKDDDASPTGDETPTGTYRGK
jgi:hypothetical protein